MPRDELFAGLCILGYANGLGALRSVNVEVRSVTEVPGFHGRTRR